MINNKIKEYLENLSKENPTQVIRKLGEGERVSKSQGLKYIIDNSEIYKQLGNYPEGAILYNPVHNHFRNCRKEIMDLFRYSNEIPFSRAYDNQVGECLEKAILLHLSAQANEEAFLIIGNLSKDNDYTEFHAYNIIFKSEKPYLIDTENPLAKDSNGKIVRPYVAPILEIKENDGHFVVPEIWRQERTYSIF